MTPKVDAIKSAIEAAGTIEEIDALAKEHGAAVTAMAEDPDLRVMAIQIKNLAAWKRRRIKEGWGG
tara:strand:- start:482 stop:679 length:198 start_codon:yes stop_codon:yes gene_type:complete